MIYKIGSAAADGLGKGSGVSNYNSFRSQSFVIDKTGATFNALYYASIENSTPTTQDVLHYMSTPELFTAPTYQLHITVTGIT